MKLRNLQFVLFILLLFGLSLSCTDEDDDLSPFVDPRNKFVGSWNVNNESCNQRRYLVSIAKDPSNSIQVILFNFGFSQSIDPDTAIVADNTITIPKQSNSENWVISGTGKYDKGNIEWNYSLLISGDLLTCTATYTP